jgi:hypothetical protein
MRSEAVETAALRRNAANDRQFNCRDLDRHPQGPPGTTSAAGNFRSKIPAWHAA